MVPRNQCRANFERDVFCFLLLNGNPEEQHVQRMEEAMDVERASRPVTVRNLVPQSSAQLADTSFRWSSQWQ